jgi:hypothetical protein
MNKSELLKKFLNVSRGNLFSLEIPSTKENQITIKDLVGVLESEGKIKLRECVQRDHSVFLHGIVKYASE